MGNPDTSRVSRESLRIASVDRPGWEPCVGRVPKVGEHVCCVGGPAKVTRVLGRTSDGSRLLQLECGDDARPFFAASSNVLVRTDAIDPLSTLSPSQSEGEA